MVAPDPPPEPRSPLIVNPHNQRRAGLLDRILAPLRQPRAALFLAISLLGLTVVYFYLETGIEKSYSLRATGGSQTARRHEVLELLARRLERYHGVTVAVVPTRGSEEALEKVSSGALDFALVQGGLTPRAEVQEVAALVPEPLHLLTRTDTSLGMAGLRGKRVNMGEAGSGTRTLSEQVMSFAGLQPNRDFIELNYSTSQLESLSDADLPDAAFVVSSLPSPVATALIGRGGYRLLEIPFAEALSLRVYGVDSVVIPAYTYGVQPALPPADLRTVGSAMLLVANESVPAAAIYRILQAILDSPFGREAGFEALTADTLFGRPQMEPHAGTVAFLKRDDPLFSVGSFEWVESARSLVVSLIVGLYFAISWWRRRHALGFEPYIAAVTDVEREALTLELAPVLDLQSLLQLRHRLTKIKNEALDAFAKGRIAGDELMTAFLAHANDARGYLNAMILHERERLEKVAARTGSPASTTELSRLWDEAIGHADDEVLGELEDKRIDD